MNTKVRYMLILALVLLGGVALVAMAQAAPDIIQAGGSPAVVSYQGQVTMSGNPYSGNGYFKFAVVNSAGTSSYWSNDNTSINGGEPTAAVQITVSNGLFSVLLGDTTLSGMTQALTASVFDQPDRYLKVWFSSDNINFNHLTPDTRIAAVPYALQAQEAVDADTVDGLHANELVTHYQNVIIVAKSGGDHASIQSAIDSISDATADNPYLVWVAPGVYNETVIMKPYVHLQGAGQDATVITSTISCDVWPPIIATLVLASDTSLRDLTVGNGGVGDFNTAVLATEGMTAAVVADVTAKTDGGGVNSLAIFLTGSGTTVTLEEVTTLAENGSNNNIGLANTFGGTAALTGGSYTARGGTNAWGIFLNTATLNAENVTALGEDGSNLNSGLRNYNYSTAFLYGGDYTGRGGNQTGGAGASHYSTVTAIDVTATGEYGSGDVGNYAFEAYDHSTATVIGGVFTARGGLNNYAFSNELTVTVKAYNVTALAEWGSGSNHGFWNANSAVTFVTGGSFTGLGGENAYGIYNTASSLWLESVAASGESGSFDNMGLANDESAVAVLTGGTFTGYLGLDAYGIKNSGPGTVLEAHNITALGDHGSANFGLRNDSEAWAELHESSFIARWGAITHGIFNVSSGTGLEAYNISAMGQWGSSTNYGLYNQVDAWAKLHGGTFTGYGGESTYGIRNAGADTALEADNITALGEEAITDNYGFYNDNNASAEVTQSLCEGASNSVYNDTGIVTLSNSRLAGNTVSGVVTCVLVTRDSTISTDGSTCP
jgi:hypothetical protein